MDWDAVGAIGEIVGASAVVLTLFYLGLQTRQSNRADRSDARQRILDHMSVAQSNFVGTPENRASLSKGLADLSALDATEYLMFNHWLLIFQNNLFNAIRLKDQGVLDDEAFKYISDCFVGTVTTTKGGAEWWELVLSSSIIPHSVEEHVKSEMARRGSDMPDLEKAMQLNR